MVNKLLKQNAHVEAKDNNRMTPLILGIFLYYLINLNYYYSLFIASKYGHIEVVKELLKQNAHVEAADNDGKTPLIWGKFLY